MRAIEPKASRLQVGTNYHLDAWRPWTFARDTDGEMAAMARFGLDLVRIVGDLIKPAEDYSGEIADASPLEQTVERSRRLGLRIAALSWNVIPDLVAREHPLVGADGNTYARGEWGLFNFWDPAVREVAIKVATNTARRLAATSGAVRYFQPTNEWTLLSYPPFGWDWRWYAGESYRAPNIIVSYDEYAASDWRRFLGDLPREWQAKILDENGVLELSRVPMIRTFENARFSPTYAAWCRFTSAAIGSFMADVYRVAKPAAGDIGVLSQSVMPYPLLMSGFPESGLGHQVDYWMGSGRSFDLLAVNTYQDYAVFPEHPFFWDGDLPLQAWYTFFRELARMYGIPGLVTSECGATSYHHSEDAQRYIVLRSLLQVAAFGRPEAIFQLLWNDDPLFEPIHEQFFGLMRNGLGLPKPAYADTRLVMRTIRRLTPGSGAEASTAPFGYVIVSRMAMDCGITHGPLDSLTARELDLRVVTDYLVERNALDPAHRLIIVADDASVSSAALVSVLLASPHPVIVPATIGQFGVDGDDSRQAAVTQLIGLRSRRLEIVPNAQLRWVVSPTDAMTKAIYRFERPVERVVFADDDLPSGSIVQARFEDGSVAVYAYGTRVIVAFGVGADGGEDPERTRFARDLTRAVGEHANIGRPVRGIDPDDPVLVYDLGSGIVAVVNTTDVDRVTTVEVSGRQIELPVAARHFSAWDYRARRFAVVSGAGSLRDNGEELIRTPEDTTVVFDDGAVEVRPRYSDRGGRTTEALLNRERLAYEIDDAAGYFSGQGDLPIVIEVSTELTIRCRADFERYVVLTSDGSTARGSFVQLTTPDRCKLLWTDALEHVDRLDVEFVWHERLGPARSQHTTVNAASQSGMVAVTAPPIVSPASVAITVTAFDAGGLAMPVPATRLHLAYEDRDVPSMSYRTGEAKMARIIHPMRFEDCSIVEVRSEAFSEGRWRRLTLNIGGRGQHARHLESSEEWQELLL
jgi:hypothetical protein